MPQRVWTRRCAASLPSVARRDAPLPPFEVLAVNDGSTDHSPALLERFACREPRLRVLHRPHAGIAAALNAGLACARGSLVARMDADDTAHPERLALQAAHLAADAGPDLSASRVAFGRKCRIWPMALRTSCIGRTACSRQRTSPATASAIRRSAIPRSCFEGNCRKNWEHMPGEIFPRIGRSGCVGWMPEPDWKNCRSVC